MSKPKKPTDKPYFSDTTPKITGVKRKPEYPNPATTDMALVGSMLLDWPAILKTSGMTTENPKPFKANPMRAK